jgi:hypothetical protein
MGQTISNVYSYDWGVPAAIVLYAGNLLSSSAPLFWESQIEYCYAGEPHLGSNRCRDVPSSKILIVTTSDILTT